MQCFQNGILGNAHILTCCAADIPCGYKMSVWETFDLQAPMKAHTKSEERQGCSQWLQEVFVFL